MARILFRLRGVPHEEAEAVRQLLDENHIEHYETPPGNWGISMPAIWVKQDQQFEEARALLDQFQAEHSQQQRAHYQAQKRDGVHHSFLDEVRRRPFHVIFYVAVILGILYLSTVPFIEFTQR